MRKMIQPLIDRKQMEYKDWEIMSGHNKAAAADVNCELTLQLPHYSQSSSIDDDRRPPSTAFLPSPYASFVLQLPDPWFQPSSPLTDFPIRPAPMHVWNHCRRSSLLSWGEGGGAASSSKCPYFRSVSRHSHTRSPGKDKSDIIPPPFPWATNRRATVQSLEYLKGLGFNEVYGESQCKHCETRINIKHDLVTKFREMAVFMEGRMHLMHNRAPQEWINPTFPGCQACGQINCMRPVMADKKRHINWLFLFLGQWLGFCTLEQLKYFCKHTRNHRTGAKDRVLYLSYRSLCKQLDPKLSFVQ